MLLPLVLALGLGTTPVPPSSSAEPGASTEGAVLAAGSPAAAGSTGSTTTRRRAATRRCKGRVALTFDDGPVPGTTTRLLRVLRRHDVPATFFVVGRRVREHPELVRAIERNGHLVANHTWAHEQLTARSDREVRATVHGTRRALQRAGVAPTRLVRPPYGSINPRVRRVLVRAGFVPVLWSIDSNDWANGSADQIAARILRGLRPGPNVVLQHDGVNRSPISVDAVATVVRRAKRRGYCFTALDEKGRPGFHTPDVSVTVTPVVEGRTAVATVRLAGEAGRDTSVRLTVRSGTARVGTDLPARTTRVAIPAGRRYARVKIPTTADGTVEPVERASVEIDAPQGVRIAGGTASLEILPPGTTRTERVSRGAAPDRVWEPAVRR